MIRVLIWFLALPVLAWADDWPGWRGPSHSGISSETKLPVQWSRTDKVRWKIPLKGAGASSPVVFGDRVFLTTSEGRLNDQLHVYAHDRKTGRQLWHTRLFGSAPTDLYAPGGMAVPTPVTDGKTLVLLFGTGDLVGLDLDGKPVWIRCLAEEYGPFRNRWGMGTSPILVDGMVIVQVDHWSQSYLLAIDPATGANKWKTDRDAAVNWSTPLPMKVNGRTQIVVHGTHRAMGYDAANGAELWSVAGMHQQCIPSPVADNGMVFAASGEGVLALRLSASDGGRTKTQLVWKNTKLMPFVPSPIAYQGYIYVLGDKGVVACLDTATGNQLWKERLGDAYHASPVAGDGKIYFTSKEGVIRVVQAGPDFKLLAENDMGETIVASPAISRGEIFLRGEKHLFCITK